MALLAATPVSAEKAGAVSGISCEIEQEQCSMSNRAG
jgi:hypothetical protein